MSARYEVEIRLEGSVFVDVEADDEDAAHDAAIDRWRDDVSVGDVDVDTATVGNVRKLEA